MDNNRKVEIEKRLSELEKEKTNLLFELNNLNRSKPNNFTNIGIPASTKVPETSEEKIDLFIKLFRCREDVYPRFWENKSGKKGFSPVCINEWVKGLCNKSVVKCTDCANQDFARLTEDVVKSHLEGRFTIGTYAIREDDTCIFLAADFDKATWQDDILAYKHSARDMGIKVPIEISKSGNGAHAWILFSESVPAYSARKLGTLILARASQNRYTLNLESYDRFFPNQDTMPKGGFGNLIALPLQKTFREKGKTVFVDDNFIPYPDQWEFLSSCKRLSLNEISSILQNSTVQSVNSYSFVSSKDNEIIEAETNIDMMSSGIKMEKFSGQINIELGSRLSINIETLPSKIINALKRTATFANPKFFELQRLRFSTWSTPRYISCAELDGNKLILPRGNIENILNLIKDIGASCVITDGRNLLNKIEIDFQGDLNSVQKNAISEIVKYEDGVLEAPPGAGKTVMACAVIALRKVPTLILVHRKQLLDQWESQLSKFLTINEKEIGIIESNHKKNKGIIDIAMLQTLAKVQDHDDYLKYEQIIIDECHHIPAISFESVLNKIPTRYFLGLTATPYRKDGLQAIIYMQCGPIRFSMKDSIDENINRTVIVKETSFKMPPEFGPQSPIHEVWDKLINDTDRTNLIAEDIRESLSEGRFPLILSERKEQLNLLSLEINKRTQDFPVKEFILIGEMGKKARKKAIDEIKESISNNVRPYILSTGSLIGEGFDMPELDTLFIAMPFSFKGKMIQYAGRLHRTNEGKRDTLIYDYVDTSMGLTISMLKKRLTAYREMGYKIEATESIKIKRLFKNMN